MGRFAKNRELKSASYSIRAPYAPGSVGPNMPVDGLIRFNTTIQKPQYFAEGEWRTFAFEGRTLITKDTFEGDGVLTNFGPLSFNYQPGEETQILVFIGNVFQNPGVHYVLNGTTISFTAPPNAAQQIIILHGFTNNNVEY